MDFSRNRNAFVLAIILLVLGGMALLQESLLVVMVLLGLLALVRQFDQNALNSLNTGRRPEEDISNLEWEEISHRQRQAQSEPIYRHALEAVERAGLDPDEVQVLAVDVGFMVFHGNETTIHRTWAIPDDADYIQPFVELRVPQKAAGRVKFELYDDDGRTMFVHEDVFNLTRGRNLLSPSARLPIHDQRDLDGSWHMRVTADGVLLAVHRFKFAEAQQSEIQRHIGEDGEIKTELRAAMAESRLPKMSLDDLLEYQQDDNDKSSGQQRSSQRRV